jgi:hypothetical protein
LPAEQISGEILKRQELGSTGTGGGVAIPHARIEGLNRSFGILARPNKPIDFEAIVGRPVDLVFLLLLPANPVGEQLKALAQHWAASALKPFRCVLALLGVAMLIFCNTPDESRGRPIVAMLHCY